MTTFQENAKSLFDKGYSAASALAAKAKIKAQIADQSLQRDTLMRKLGEAVYEEVRLDQRYRDAFPELFAQIEEVDERKQALEDELSRMSANEVTSAPIDIEPIQVSTEDDTSDEDSE